MANPQFATANVAKYAVLHDQRVIVHEGVEMRVREGFYVDGELILIGLLSVGAEHD